MGYISDYALFVRDNLSYTILIIILTLFLTADKRTFEKFKKIYTNTPIYWKFYFGVLVITGVFFVGFYYYAKQNNPVAPNNFFNFSNYFQIVALAFAGIGGYYAYAQFSDLLFERLQRNGQKFYDSRMYHRALHAFLDADRIRKDFYVLANLAELSVIEGLSRIYHNAVGNLRELRLEPMDQLAIFYLEIIHRLANNNIDEAELSMKELITFSTVNSGAYDRFSWSLENFRNSRLCKKFNGKKKDISDDLFKFLEQDGSLSLSDRKSLQDKYLNL